VNLWNVQTGRKVATFDGLHEAAVWSVAFNIEGNVVASGSSDATITLWKLSK